MLKRLRAAQSEEGFTLVELLIVIVILGVLAGVVVFAVSGITDRGEDAACGAEKQTLITAQQAYYAKNKTFAANAAALQGGGFIATTPKYYETTGGSTVSLKSLAPATNPCTV